MYCSVDLHPTYTPAEKKKRYRVSAAATFEVLPSLLGMGSDIILQGVTVDHSRNIVKFHFVGDGLKEYGFGYTPEGQEGHEVIPPAWQAKQNELNS